MKMFFMGYDDYFDEPVGSFTQAGFIPTEAVKGIRRGQGQRCFIHVR